MKRMLPPTLVLSCLVSMILLHWLLPITSLLPAYFNLLGMVPLVLGVVLNVGADRTFKIAQTSVSTFNEPDKLVTHGLFRYSRNPMYLGFVLILAGAWMLLGSASPFLGVAVFFLVSNCYYIPFEEHMLAKKFGTGFEAYTSKTRCWI
jgi:protein-S-isoprenylcysteine O-methyltransferase Ste14